MFIVIGIVILYNINTQTTVWDTFYTQTFFSKTFTEDHRCDINLAYWIQAFAERQRWLDTNVFISNTNKTGDKVRNVALSYYLLLNVARW